MADIFERLNKLNPHINECMSKVQDMKVDVEKVTCANTRMMDNLKKFGEKFIARQLDISQIVSTQILVYGITLGMYIDYKRGIRAVIMYLPQY